MSTPHKLLIFDLETAPLLAHIWHPAEDYVNPDRVLHDSFLLSWAAKWHHHKKKVSSQALTSTEAKDQDDSRIIQGLAEMVEEADSLVAHNADKFDVRVLRSRILETGAEPLTPVKTIDTLKLARRSFRLASNRLNYLAKLLGVETKHDTGGFSLWRQCYLGNAKALKKMERYNRQDVRVLESVFDQLRPYVKGLPRMVDADIENERVCPYCGEENVLHKRGFYRTNASTFQRWKCTECGRWCRSRSAEKSKKLSHVPITTR